MSWLQPTPEDEQDIQQLREERPERYAYAQVLALALRIDSRLLRNLRLRFFPKSSVELETELWFSSLIHTRNVQAATMYSGIARALCDALKNENLERFASAKTEIGKLTHHWPETDRIEQEMRWAVLEGDEQTLKKSVQRILKALTLVEGDFEKRELARCVKGTLPILKATTQADTEQQWLSQYVAASLGLAGKWWAEDAEVQPLPKALVKALPKSKKQKIGLRLRPGILEVLKPKDGVEAIDVYLPLPTMIILEFNQEKYFEPFWIGRLIRIPKNIKNFNLRMLDGTSNKIIYRSNLPTKRFRVALAFPSEYRDYVSQVAAILGQKLGQDAVFYDQWYTAELARPNMDTHLQAIYHDHAELIVPFLCADYERKQWCGLEWRAIRDLLKKRQDNDIMPLRFDDTDIPGLFSIDGYIDLRRRTPEQIAEFIIQRAKPQQQSSTVTTIHSTRLPTIKRFQIALAFPGEYRDYVSQVAAILGQKLGQDTVFYDQWYTAELARPNMDTHLQAIYHDHAELIVPFLCADYERKQWCGLEWRAIRDLLKKRQDNDIMPLRFDDTEIPGLYGIDGYIDLRRHTPEQIAGFILQRVKPRQQSTVTLVHSDRLPTVKGSFFGREAELQLLNDAWAGNATRIIQFIAPGGTGKTKLLRHWLDHTGGIDMLIAWSFYSQGASEDKQTSAAPFFNHAFEKLGSIREKFATEEDKGEHLAELLRHQRCVLVLDGLETLQHTGSGMRGELKDRAIRQLLKSLAGRNNGLCIITTRIAVHELVDRSPPAVISHNLQNLASADGIKLLQSLGVKGSLIELDKVVHEYGGNTLALTLLGNILRLRYQGDVQRRDTLRALVKPSGSQESRHAFKVMQAYEEWFAGQPEMALLHLLGLFDHPIEQAVLQVLWDAQIPNLTAGIDEDAWLEAIAGLREEHHLLSVDDGGGDLDCHPLIREYFGKQLQTQHPAAWQQAHATLYAYYKALPEKELPDTLEEMQPLFNAVAHGCKADLHQKVLEEVYWPRIQRKGENYLCNRLGAFNEDLTVIAHFFTIPWQMPAAGLRNAEKAAVLGWVGFRLCALGRLREAVEPIQLGIDHSIKQANWIEAAANTSNLSELQLILGDLTTAISSAEQSVMYADKSGDLFHRMSKRTTYADALLQTGQLMEALLQFQTAETLQQERQPSYPRLYSLWGFRYCDLLLEQGATSVVLDRAVQTLDWVTQAKQDIVSIALNQLSLSRAILQQGDVQQAGDWVEQAVAGLRAAGRQDYLPHGLLTRAALFRHTHDLARARQDLQEVFDIAEPAGMRLHLTDYHLEMTRLLIAEGEFSSDSVNGHLNYAAKLISETGYHRRDKELVELQKVASEKFVSN